jgi:hypothetical protein
VTYFVGTVMDTVSTFIQMTIEYSVWSAKYGFMKGVIMRGLCALCNEGSASLTSDSDQLWNHLLFSLLLSKHFLMNDFF